MHPSAGEECIGTHNLPAQTLIGVPSKAAPPVPGDEMRHPVIPQPSAQASSPTEMSSEPPIAVPEVKNSIEGSILPQPLPAPPEAKLTADTHAASRAQHKASAMTRDPTNSPETMPAVTIPAQYPIAVSVPQPDRPEQTLSKNNVQPAIRVSMGQVADGAVLPRLGP